MYVIVWKGREGLRGACFYGAATRGIFGGSTGQDQEAVISDGPTFFLTAAEHSGDALGAALIGALKRKYPAARFVGVGGELMANAGCELLADPVTRSAMLVGAVVTGFWYWSKLLKRISVEMAKLKPDVVIPIDSSFINLRVAAAAKGLGLKVCYYVAPQLWASRPGRIAKLKACVDTLCCVLPFEEAYFRERGVNAVYVGHPMFDRVVGGEGSVAGGEVADGDGVKDEDEDKDEDREKEEKGDRSAQRDGTAGVVMGAQQAPVEKALPSGVPRVAVFPGSRAAEIRKHMPAMLQVMTEIKGRHPRVSFVAAAPSEARAWEMRRHLRGANLAVDIRVGQGDEIISWSDLVLAKSGTVTLQIARQAKPMVVMFAVAWWQWAVARHFIHTRYIVLVNILAGREIVPEFVPFHGSAMPVARACLELLAREDLRAAMAEELRQVVAPLMPTEGRLAAERVAEEVAKLVSSPAQS